LVSDPERRTWGAYDNKMLRRIFVLAMEDEENYVMRSFIICTLHQTGL
jgi:hypothetical protein